MPLIDKLLPYNGKNHEHWTQYLITYRDHVLTWKNHGKMFRGKRMNL